MAEEIITSANAETATDHEYNRRKAQCRDTFYATVHSPDNSKLKIDLTVVFYLLAVL